LYRGKKDRTYFTDGIENPHFELKVALEQCGTYGSVKDGEKQRNNKRPMVTLD
jgi:hypothetical protein